ncbi:MAG: kinase/pyrophosphorylase [Eggerthellaceae bacterium]|nr:kinase/pyrophosphorylase [Eggerthellaceae bacterium]
MHEDIQGSSTFPTVHVVSDSVGETARTVAQAAAAQFGVTNPKIEVLGKVKTFEEVRDHLLEHARYHVDQLGDDRLLIFYTLVDPDLRDAVHDLIESHENMHGVDLLTNAIEAMSKISGLEPKDTPGALRVADINYFKRVEALEFTIEHDDGRNPQDLTKADIVVIGVSRTSKTPVSIYLAQHGYHVANVPLDLQTDPPQELFDVDPSRIFGLISTPDALSGIRSRRIGQAASVAGSYADPEYIYEDLERARKLMRKLGCYTIRTDGKALEETCQEILTLYMRTHG